MRAARRAVSVSLLALAATLASVAVPATATASGRQVSVFQDDVALLQNPVATMQELRHLGVTTVRLLIRWSFIAPDPKSRKRPNFNASNPNAYPAKNWAPYDAVVAAARADGIQLLLNPTAFAPLWAQGPNPGRFGAHYNFEFAFMPSANEYRQFVVALGKRYPSVHAWELYNEPNFGEDLAPQGINQSKVLYSPVMYRGLVNAAWSGLHASGHGRDTIIVGALAAHGAHIPSNSKNKTGLPGAYGETPPLEFIRELYCLDSHYHQYRGNAAKVRKCPTTVAASRRFRSHNQALFNNTAWSDHPYPLGKDGSTPPTKTHYTNPNFAGFSQLPNMLRALDKAQRAYRSSKRFPLWNTEYGYITNPPNRSGSNASLATQAFFDNWAEYLSWKNSRIASSMQYLLIDPNPSVGTPECGGFASGIIFFGTPPSTRGCSAYPPGAAKPGLQAYRLPIYLPNGTASRGRAVTVWGCVRPARYALLDTHRPQTALIQFQRGGRGSWSTVATVTFSNPASSCFFTRQVKFPASGSVRLIYSYPATDARLYAGYVHTYFDPLAPTISRSVSVTIR
ncbi:MAG TPA: hypothetical protein VGF81_01990 [Solirubrobacteraceae bacterium]